MSPLGEQHTCPLDIFSRADMHMLFGFVRSTSESYVATGKSKYTSMYVPHKVVAEVSKIAKYRRLVDVNHALQNRRG